jgi:threonine aldolase
MFCLSKGLGAPVGSILAGSKEFIHRARKNRKRLGCGMRQVGILAAAGLYALDNRGESITKAHSLAEELAAGIKELNLTAVTVKEAETNFVILQVNQKIFTTEELVTKLAEKKVKVNAFGSDLIRIVTHRDISRRNIEKTLEVLKEI